MMPDKRDSQGDLETKLEWLQTKYWGDQSPEILNPEFAFPFAFKIFGQRGG